MFTHKLLPKENKIQDKVIEVVEKKIKGQSQSYGNVQQLSTEAGGKVPYSLSLSLSLYFKLIA